MGIIDKLFGRKKPKPQVKQTMPNMTMAINASTAIFPSWQTLRNVDTYLTIDDVYSIISLLAETAARLPMYGYAVVEDEAYKRYKRFEPNSIHGRYYRRKAMMDLPDDDKFYDFLSGISYQDRIQYFSLLFMNGELFLWKEQLEMGPNAGKINLHVLNSENVQVIISESFPQRVVGYKYWDAGFNGTFSADEVIHIKYFNPSISTGQQWRGLSPLQVLTRRITRLNSSMDASVAQMQNGGVPGIVYEKSDYAIETLGQRKNDFAQYLRQSSNKGAPYFAAGEMGYLEIGAPLADLQILEAAGVDFTKLCNAYKVPEIVLNNNDASTYNNMNTALKMLYTNSILPNVYLFRDAIKNSVLPMFMDGIKRTIEVDISDIPALQDDMKAQADALAAMWWVTPNEKREIQMFEELPDPVANQIIIDSGKMLLSDLDSDVPDVDMPELTPHV